MCFNGECVDCIDTLSDPKVCGPGNACQGVYCVSGACGASCGDGCAPCPPSYGCNSPSDCEEGVCGQDGMCALPNCNDNAKNDGETGVDCGIDACGTRCPDNQGCANSADCKSGVCWAGVCEAPACTDGIQNGKETGIDCGDNCEPCVPPL